MAITIRKIAHTSGVDCVINTTEISGGMGNGSSNGLLDTDVGLDDIDPKICILSKSLCLSSRLLGPFQIDVSHDQATSPFFRKG